MDGLVYLIFAKKYPISMYCFILTVLTVVVDVGLTIDDTIPNILLCIIKSLHSSQNNYSFD